jgi:hypothetical protein
MQKMLQISEQASIPAHVLQLAKEYQLGQLRSCHRRRFHRFLPWIRTFWLISISIPCLYYLSLAILSGLGQDTDALWIDICGITLFTFPLITSVLEFIGMNPFWGIKAYLYVMDRGLTLINGGTTKIVKWDDIEKLYWSKKQIISSIIQKEGPKFSYIGFMDNAREVSMAVAGAVTERLLPEMLARYQRTGKVKFDSLSVMPSCITNWGKSGPQAWAKVIPWDEIEDVRFERGKLGVKINDEWKDWSNGFFGMYILPNPTVCVALIRQILQQREQEKA